MKTPEEVRRIELTARIEQSILIAKNALHLAPSQYAVPKDHPLAKALEDARLALTKAEAIATQTLSRFGR